MAPVSYMPDMARYVMSFPSRHMPAKLQIYIFAPKKNDIEGIIALFINLYNVISNRYHGPTHLHLFEK